MVQDRNYCFIHISNLRSEGTKIQFRFDFNDTIPIHLQKILSSTHLVIFDLAVVSGNSRAAIRKYANIVGQR